MLDHLYQSQCNDAYWHGVFGGLYLPHLRSAVYEHLIQAELLADKALKGQGSGVKGQGKTRKMFSRHGWISRRAISIMDGSEEVMLNSGLMNLFIDPAEGGRIYGA